MYIYIYIYAHTQHTHARARARAHTHTHTHIHIDTHTYTPYLYIKLVEAVAEEYRIAQILGRDTRHEHLPDPWGDMQVPFFVLYFHPFPSFVSCFLFPSFVSGFLLATTTNMQTATSKIKPETLCLFLFVLLY